MGCAAGHGLKETAVDKKKEKAWALIAPAATAAYLALLPGCSRVEPLDPPEPTIEYATELKLGKAGIDLKRDLRPGSYVVEVRERDIDIKLKVAAATALVTLADDVRRHGLLVQIVRLEEPAAIRLRLENDDDPTKSGAAQIRILRLQSESPEPATELESGYAAFAAADPQIALDVPEARARAVEHMRNAITHFAAAGDVANVAQAQYSLAFLQYRTRNEWLDAMQVADDARRSYAMLRDATGVANALTLRASSEIEAAAIQDASSSRNEQLRMFAHADHSLVEAWRYFHEHGMQVREAYALNMRGVGFYYRGDIAAAATLFAEAAALSRSGHDNIEELRSRQNLAAARFALGYVAEAAEEYQRVLDLIDRDRNRYLHATAQLNFGWSLVDLGEFDRAIALFADALDGFTVLDQKQERAVTLSALGQTYQEMGDAERALPALLDAAEESRKTNDAQGVASALRAAGEAAAALGRHAEALALLNRALDSILAQHVRSRLRIDIARELRSTGKVREAEAELAQALPEARGWIRAAALEQLALIRLAQGQLRTGIGNLRDADRGFAEYGMDLYRIRTQTELSSALLRAGDSRGAATAADAAIAIERLIRLKSDNAEWRARFLSSRYAPYEARIAAHFAAADVPETDRSWRGFRVAEMVRARSLNDRLARTRGAEAPVRDAGADELRAQLAALYSTLERSLDSSNENDRKNLLLRTRIEELRARLDKHLSEHGAVAAHSPSIPESLAEVQSQLPPSTAVLAFFAGDDATHVWVLTHAFLRHRIAPGGRDLDPRIRAFVAELRAGKAQDSGTRLARTLLGGLFDGVAENRLVVLADGPLNALPFAALPAPGGKPGEQLVDRFVIAIAPSLQLAMTSAGDGGVRRARIAIVSDPVFTNTDRRLLASQDEKTGNLRGPESLARLPYSAIEARAVRNAFDIADSIDLKGFDANVSRVLALESQSLHVLHFATHAETHSESPEMSALYLSRYGADGAPVVKDRLTADDIINSGLRADLVVLSGCATGTGGELRGEGVLGLTYGFLANGSSSVVASLWQIEDAPTAHFMESFYSAYRQTGRAADALRIAQLDARRAARNSVWSSFVVRANGFP